MFNELYEAHRSLLREDELLFVQGRVMKDEYTGGVRINADRVCDLAEARAFFAKRLRVRLNGIASGEAVRAAIEPFSQPVRAGGAGVPVVLVHCFDASGERPSVIPDERQGGREAARLSPFVSDGAISSASAAASLPPQPIPSP